MSSKPKNRTINQTQPESTVQDSKARYFETIASYTWSDIDRLDRKYYQKIVNILSVTEHKTVNHKREINSIYKRKYEIYRDDTGTLRLIKKRQSPDDPILICLPTEDSYDALHEIHISQAHPGEEEMLQLVKDKYMVEDVFITFYMQCCQVCNEIKYFNESSAPDTEKDGSKIIGVGLKRVQIDILDFTSICDGDFCYILAYTDVLTSFVLLRPLMCKQEDEVASELIKIITSFGPPEAVLVPIKDRHFYNRVMEVIVKMGLKGIPIKFQKNSATEHLEKSIHDWMEETSCQSWGIGCHVIQWTLNNKLTSSTGYNETINDDDVSPHLKVFGSVPYSYYLKNNSVGDSDTEDLKILLEQHELEKSRQKSQQQSLITNNTAPKCDLNETQQNEDNSTKHFAAIECDENMVPKLVMLNQKTNYICHICECKMAKVYSCSLCLKPAHLFCSEKSKPDLYVCFKCSNIIKM